MTAEGTLDWVPGQSPWGWLSAAALLAASVTALGPVAPAAPVWLAAVTGSSITADILHSVGFASAVGEGFMTRLGLIAVQLMMWPFAAVVVVLLLRRRTGASWLAAVVGASAVFTSGWSDLPVLWHSSAPSVLPPLPRTFSGATPRSSRRRPARDRRPPHSSPGRA